MHTEEMAWGIYIAVYLFLAGSGAGAYLTAVTAEIYSRHEFRPLIRAGILVSGPLVALGLPFLILDLGAGRTQPWRLVNMFFGNFGSIMTLGAWIITLFVIVAFTVAFLEIDPKLPVLRQVQDIIRPYRQKLFIGGALLAFATAIYTGLLIGVVNGVPLWNTSVLPGLFFVSAMSTGMAAAVVFAVTFPQEDRRLVAEHFFYLNQIHALLIVMELIFVFCWLFLTANASVTAAASVEKLLWGSLALPFWIGLVFFGIVDPLLIYIYEVVLHRPLKPYAMVVSDGSVLVGGFVLRYLTLSAAVPVILW